VGEAFLDTYYKNAHKHWGRYPLQHDNYRQIALKPKHFRSIFDESMSRKWFSHFRSPWPWPL